ncbi:hypothetical protein UP10_02530 [Bradyrhizobium sp. LTSPM299]|uniref:hypothetical protein n=1 Tax=Bradyrhizobium sp. LTSPM299 TaxID=1619233 RepID=UPI0005C91BE4|nr:hypothetical protein [Bradyrhizobium sp. LTSPM299]KJC62241.1 hypothetical protein UP10_02530 [Bradyrhizobium sp. LTSPM299]
MHWIDPDHLPEVKGTVDLFLVNKHGEADGFLMTDGCEVHVPPHLSPRLLRDVRPGSEVRVRGVRPRATRMISAVAIDTAKGRLLDEGPDKRPGDHEFEPAEHAPMAVQGIVRQPIHGPKGETRGAVLEDGRIIRLPPHEAERLADLFVAGRKIAAKGEGATTSFGTVIEAKEIGPSADTLKAVKPKHGPDHKKPKHGPDHKKPKHHEKRDCGHHT